MKYEEALEYIESIKSAGIRPGLDSIRALCKEIGNPQDDLKFVHVAGTNGKGSTVCFISTVLQKAGYKTGRFVSPVIFDIRDMYSVNSKLITKKAFGEKMEVIKNACDSLVEKGLPQPTPFEVETALAFLYFKDMGCDIVVLETGMGGLMDATNIIKNPLVCVFTSIAMDHMQFLGSTLAEIAKNKAGIIKPGASVLIEGQDEDVMNIIKEKAELNRCFFDVAEDDDITGVKSSLGKQTFNYKNRKKLAISMAGRYQIKNACVALDALDELIKKGFNISEKAVFTGLLETGVPGRFQVISKNPLIIADGAHNPDGAERLAESIEFYFTNKRIVYIMGMLKDKDYRSVIALTEKYADEIITVTPPENERALPAYELAKEIGEVHRSVSAVDSVEEALEVAGLMCGKDDVIIAFGSLSFMGRLIDDVIKSDKKRKIVI
ncbi:MAG: bifunctional folylpolyglutamate synthase/dihydrofolate synthase [Lachnospiraceae bacterium]|nr:bifunctional folylpolyglutamate synthase/dihydrofolate synthase [Lachnospiraceae bacterium]